MRSDGRGLTVQQIARMFHLSESRVKQYVKQGAVRQIDGKGPRGAKLYDERDVDNLGRRLRLGDYGTAYRRVIVLEGVHEDVTLALKAAELVPLPATSLLDAVAQHPQPGMPLLVVPARMTDQDAKLLDFLAPGVYCVVVGYEGVVSERLRRRSVLVDPNELRKLVQVVWSIVERRIRQVELKL